MKLKSLLSGLAALLFACAASAQADYPTRVVRIVIPFATGGSVDVSARLVAQRLAERLGQPVIVESRPGAGGAVACEYVARSAPDGYTLVWGTVSTHAINASLHSNLRYDNIKDFEPITLLMQQPLLLVVPVASPVGTLQDLLRAQRANPGKSTFGSAGVGTTGHLTGELLKRQLGADMTHIVYKGSNPMLTDLIGGTIDLGIDNLPSAIAQVKAGRLKALAITSRERSSLAPNVPTLAETVPGMEVVAWQGLFAPAGTPPAILERLSREVREILREPALEARLLEMGTYPVGSSREQFAAFVKSETARWAEVVKASGAKAQ